MDQAPTHTDKARAFARTIGAALGTRIQCVALVGSVARGDHSRASDIDLWIILDQILSGDLAQIGQIVGRMGRDPEINPQCVTWDELRTPAFQQQFSSMQLRTDGVVLLGRLALPAPTREELRREAAAIAGRVLMSARHYITTQEPEAALRNGKLERWVLKSLMWALRYDVAARTDFYPRTLEQLRTALSSKPARALVEACEQLRAGEFEGECGTVLAQAESAAHELLVC